MKILLNNTDSIFNHTLVRRGSYVFTSCITNQNNYILMDYHLERLFKGASYLNNLEIEHYLKNKEQLLHFLKVNFQPNYYYRLSIIGEEIVVQSEPHRPLAHEVFLALAKNKKSKTTLPDYLKTPNYVMADIELAEIKKMKPAVDDVLFLDEEHFLTETSSSNLFIVTKSGEIKTPPSSSVVLEGVLRRKLIEYLDVTISSIHVNELENASEIWLTNSVQGIRRVNKFEEMLFDDKKVYDKIVSSIGRFGEKL